MAKRKVRTGFKVGTLIIVFFSLGMISLFTLPKEKKEEKNDNKTTEVTGMVRSKKKQARLTLVGDLLFESPFYESVQNGYDANNYFSLVKHYLLEDDLSIGNMEVVIGDDTLKVSGDGYNFCAPMYIGDLVSSLDFQILSTANNHSYDRGLDGINSTINYFKNTKIKTVGTYLNEEERKSPRILDINGIKFGFLAYTYGTNQRVDPSLRSLLGLYRNPDTKMFDQEYKSLIRDEVDKLKESSDVIIVMMHWGNEFTYEQNDEQKSIATFLNELGVDIIYGGHSHCMQPIEVIGNEHKTLVYYSLGNFVSNDDDIERTQKGQETFDNAYQIGLLSTLNVIMDEDKNIAFDNIKTEPIINYFDKNMSSWLLIPYKEYTEEYEKSHFRYNLGLTKDFIKSTYESVIDGNFR